MLTNERFELILNYMRQKKRASVAELSEMMYVSEATVRRDLSQMQKLGMLQRTHGGAVYAEAAEEVSIFVRQTVNAAGKEETATIALKRLPEFDTIFIDNSSTSLALAGRMDFRHKVVVTNGFQIAGSIMQQEQVRVFMPGGEFLSNTSLTGGSACSAIREYHFDVLISSCTAIGPDGAYESSTASRDLKQTALECADYRILLADSTKFSRHAPFRTAPLQSFDAIFTNADDETLEPYRKAGLTIINK